MNALQVRKSSSFYHSIRNESVGCLEADLLTSLIRFETEVHDHNAYDLMKFTCGSSLKGSLRVLNSIQLPGNMVERYLCAVRLVIREH